ncbi:MAG: DUF1731 domain-containing protein [Planctomycetota bacterium]
MNRLWLAALTDDAYRGAYMATAPEPVPNRVFMRELRRACRRPWSPPAPALAVRFGARFLLRTDPELALLGRRVVPSRLIAEHGFRFDYPKIGPALQHLLR